MDITFPWFCVEIHVALSDGGGPEDIQKFLLYQGLAAWRETEESIREVGSPGASILLLAFRQQAAVETHWEQERIGADLRWGTSGTLEKFKAILQAGAVCCANLYVSAILISFVVQLGRYRAIQITQNT